MTINSSTIQSYNDCLKRESGKNDFNSLNFYIIQKSDGLEKRNLLITLKVRRELPVFLSSILEYCQEKYERIEKTNRIAHINDLVYYGEKVWRVIQLVEGKAIIQDLIEKKSDRISLATVVAIDPTDYIFQFRKIKIDFSSPSLKIISYYESYFDWLKIIRKKYSGFLEHCDSNPQEKIHSKALVISPDSGYYKRILTELSQIPFICDNQNSASCTSFFPIANIYKAFDIAENIQKINQEYNEVVVIGDNNIRKHLSEVIRLTDRGIIKRFILIGTEKPETNFPLTEWHWTIEEYKIWNDKPIGGEIRLKITGETIWNGVSNGVEELKVLVTKIIDTTQSLRQNIPGIRLDKVYYLVNEYLRYLLPPNYPHLAEIAQKINDYLNCDDFKDAFYEKSIFDQETIKDWSNQLRVLFDKLNYFFQTKSPKFNHIKSSLRSMEDLERFSGGRYILATRDLLEECRGIKDLHNEQYRIGSIPLFDCQNTSFDKIIDSELNTPNAQFIFPFIFNRAQLETMIECNGDVKLYLYEGLEDFKYVKVLEAYQKQFLNKIQGEDRKLFFNSEYVISEKHSKESSDQTTEQNTDSHNGLFAEFNKLSSERRNFFEQLYNVDDVDYQSREYQPQDTSEYEITFEDGETFVLPAFRRIILVEKSGNDEQRHFEIPLGSVTIDQEIIVYRNHNKHLIYNILKEQDKSGLIQEIEMASNLWFSTVREIHHLIKNNYWILEQLFADKGIKLTYQTLHGYLLHERKFPAETETLEAIRHIAIDKELSNSYLKIPNQLQNILKRKKQYLSLTIILGKGISDEIIRHFLTGVKGDILEKLDPDIFEVLKLNVKQGKVKSILKKK
ncbi:MAG: hypothetical protein NT175_06425 [Bacteroidetes bacterium]|nr:hypothetical protein [Bacteroidota bacterium]